MSKFNEIGIVCGPRKADGSEYLENGWMEARISDDVLNDEDWAVCPLLILDGIVSISDYRAADAVFGFNVHRTAKELVEWTQYECDESRFPHVYHELKAGSFNDK